MSNFLNEYPVFEDNQVLTSSQLNDMVAYLDEQSRITRGQLLGNGIACGLKLKYEKFGVSGSETVNITINTGMGISSTGLFINMGTCTYDRYRTYTMPVGVSYAPFMNGNTQKTIYELLKVGEQTLPGETITTLTPANCADMVVLLFMETVDLDIQSCLGKACDENGKERIFNLRKLLINKNALSSYVGSVPFPTKLSLPELVLRRPLFDHANPTSFSTFTGFSSTYRSTFSANFLSPANNTSFYSTLFNALIDSYAVFAPLLQNEYGGSNPFMSGPPQAWNDYINGVSNIGPNDLGMQYFYDFMNDMVMAYHEFRAYANELLEDCCADSGAFPNHLMLGEPALFAANSGGGFRHYFKPSSLVNGQNTELEAAIFYHKRMVLMFRKFDFDIINNQPKSPATPIRITPTIQNSDRLSKRAIPFYYKADEADSSLGGLKLWQVWNYNYKTKGLLDKGILPYSYRTQDVSQATAKSISLTPLYYNLDKYDSFKVEGHLGADIDAAKTAIEGISNSFDLPFNVVKLRLSGAATDIATRYNFDDLRTEYLGTREQLRSLMQRVVDRFGYSNNTVRQFPKFITDFLTRLRKGDLQSGSVNRPQIGEEIVGISIDTTQFPLGQLDSSFNGLSAATSVNLRALFPALTSGQNNVTIPNGVGPMLAADRNINDVIAKFNTNTSPVADVVTMVTSLNAILNGFLPFNFAEFDFGYTNGTTPNTSGNFKFMEHYTSALEAAINVKVGYNQLLDLIIRNRGIQGSPELYATILAYLNEHLGLIEEFITNDLHKSLTILYYTFKFRVNSLIAKDVTLFSNFIKKHSGIEHNAGVKKGGTLVLLQAGTAATGGILANHVIADFSLPYFVSLENEFNVTTPTAAAQLAIPSISRPFYVEYNMGDFAFANDTNMHVHNLSTLTSSAWIYIDVIPQLQLDTTVLIKNIRLYLIDKNGNKIVQAAIGSSPLLFGTAGSSTAIYRRSEIVTGNYCNFPTNSTPFGNAAVVSNLSTELRQKLAYKPVNKYFVGTDSFYYMFEVIAFENNVEVVKSRSNVGKITLHIDNVNALNVTYPSEVTVEYNEVGNILSPPANPQG